MAARRILLGVIGKPHGVRGLARVVSYADDPADLTSYGELFDDQGRRFVLTWAAEGVAGIAEVVDGKKVPVRDRDAAQALTNTRLYVRREDLPQAGEDEFYLADLIGMRAVDSEGRELGNVALVHDYGGGASLEITGAAAPVLVPFTRKSVPVVDLAAGLVTVVKPHELEAPGDGAGALA
jgi:16S rRNA processing protein RimM